MLTNRSSKRAKRCWLHEAVYTRMQCKWFAERSIAPHIFSCQYVDKSSWQDERKVFREDEGTISVVLDEQKPFGFAAELAGVCMRLCRFFSLELCLKKNEKKVQISSIAVAIILRKYNLHLCIFEIFQICSDVTFVIPDSANINSSNFVNCHRT